LHDRFFLAAVFPADLLCVLSPLRHCVNVLLFLTFLFASSTSAQGQCTPVDSVRFPVDSGSFHVMQSFGVPSGRHQGRYHTGEDWYGGRGVSAGTRVQAIANGRVTYASPNGWGRDGGVIIIEHTFPDGTVLYSEYGHIAEAEGVTFPPVLSCVTGGMVIAVVGDVRPAPHLHFEIKTTNPDRPGAGYSWAYPTAEGYRRPSKTVLNWDLWLNPAHAWHADLGDETAPIVPPVLLSDESLIYLDGDRVSLLSSDGRVLWRVNLDHPAVGIVGQGFGAAVIFADGSVRLLTPDGTWSGENWQIGFPIDQLVLDQPESNRILLRTDQNVLLVVERASWTWLTPIADVPHIIRAAASGDLISVITDTNEMRVYRFDGTLIDAAFLREPGVLFALADGFYAFTRGGFWRINAAGEWTLPLVDTLSGGESAAVSVTSAGEFYLFDGYTLFAYGSDQIARWRVDLPGVSGETRLINTGEYLILTSSYGDIAAVRAFDGAFCNGARMFGDLRSNVWSDLGDDGVLRVYVADQIVGLDWQEFLLGCG